MRFADVPVGATIRFIAGSTQTYHKFEPAYVSYINRGNVQRSYIKPNTEVQEIVDDETLDN